MSNKDSYRGIEEIYDELKEGETVVILKRDWPGFFLHIGDKTASNSWVITEEEAKCLYGLLRGYFKEGAE